ncbi:ECF-type sigma factor [Roseiconus lacunae]|uniref:ECF-type sigma factor n=1 Tax=Roseiconus lacunae TaxID=2605694 RepID=A0ABT7PCF1_9BACT|nr:ECF-type sigma factor [Roseiconus lacunae]MCD0459005.1 RNA polymerase subunit sigma-70 [Roseiconus lacunae]MDM4014180.1 ECF-type sigma factor [Roseiconus lacunae]WRQ53476.1 ECF-type sigma factor [Stieleria sp. HD01]
MSDLLFNHGDESGEVTNWFRNLENGDEQAAEKLWEYCFPKMLAHSKRRLPPNFRKALDEEDIALSAFRSLCSRARRGHLQSIQGRDELIKLLTVITTRKTLNHIKFESREKRGSGKVRGESWFFSSRDHSHANSGSAMEQCEAAVDTPALMAQYTEQCKRMLDELQDPVLETIVLLRLEGYGIDEIAERMGCAKRTVERRLKLIREIWKQHQC